MAGIVTDRDLVVEILALGINPVGVRVGDLASETIARVSEDADLASARAVSTW